MLWAAVAERLRRPLISQVAELTVDGGTVRGKRQTEFGYDMIEAPLPAVVAVSDAINEPRYPSLKGIMGAKKKPQETLSLADLGVDADARRRGRLADDGARRSATRRRAASRARSRTTATARREDRRVPRREEAAVTTLVFLEHHEGELQKGSLGVLAKARALGGDVAGVVARRGVAGSPSRPAATARDVYVADDPRSRRRCRSRGSTRSRSSSRDERLRHRLFAQSVLAADVAAGLAARLDAGLNWDLTDLDGATGELVGKRPALGDSVFVDVAWKGDAADRARPLRHLRPGRDRRRAPTVAGRRRSSSRTSRRRRRCSSRRTQSRRARRSRTPT